MFGLTDLERRLSAAIDTYDQRIEAEAADMSDERFLFCVAWSSGTARYNGSHAVVGSREVGGLTVGLGIGVVRDGSDLEAPSSARGVRVVIWDVVVDDEGAVGEAKVGLPLAGVPKVGMGGGALLCTQLPHLARRLPPLYPPPPPPPSPPAAPSPFATATATPPPSTHTPPRLQTPASLSNETLVLELKDGVPELIALPGRIACLATRAWATGKGGEGGEVGGETGGEEDSAKRLLGRLARAGAKRLVGKVSEAACGELSLAAPGALALPGWPT